jgi:hypothetical protein
VHRAHAINNIIKTLTEKQTFEQFVGDIYAPALITSQPSGFQQQQQQQQYQHQLNVSTANTISSISTTSATPAPTSIAAIAAAASAMSNTSAVVTGAGSISKRDFILEANDYSKMSF